jgi:hypothetical protein
MPNETHFRGTKEFTVELSLDNIAWTTVADETLQDASGYTNCALVRVEAFCLDSPMEARFIKFTSNSHYGKGGGLNFIDWSNGNT